MPTKKHRYMIVLDEETNEKLKIIQKIIHTKQKSKAIKFLIDIFNIKDLTDLYKEIEEINK